MKHIIAIIQCRNLRTKRGYEIIILQFFIGDALLLIDFRFNNLTPHWTAIVLWNGLNSNYLLTKTKLSIIVILLFGIFFDVMDMVADGTTLMLHHTAVL